MHRRRGSDCGRSGAGLTLNFEADGAELFAGAAAVCLPIVRQALSSVPAEKAGTRLNDLSSLAQFVDASGPIGRVAARILGPEARPIRAIYFDKSEAVNWALGWHQDRTIAVQERREVEGFGPWTSKQGVAHVAPPAELLAKMVTLRVHLDDVDSRNAPLLISPGSHLSGRIPEAEIDETVERNGVHACAAKAGDVWLYSTLILHASERAKSPRRRRVLQMDYSVDVLPGGLRWVDLIPSPYLGLSPRH